MPPERALQAELTTHLGYEEARSGGPAQGQHAQRQQPKTLKGDSGELETPRDRQATFEPKIVARGQTRWTGFDDKIVSLYAQVRVKSK